MEDVDGLVVKSQVNKCTDCETQLKQQSPRSLLRSFNPLPSEEILKKLNYYFFPYNKTINTSKCMYFDDGNGVVAEESRADAKENEEGAAAEIENLL